jgi:hypothetical protein
MPNISAFSNIAIRVYNSSFVGKIRFHILDIFL